MADRYLTMILDEAEWAASICLRMWLYYLNADIYAKDYYISTLWLFDMDTDESSGFGRLKRAFQREQVGLRAVHPTDIEEVLESIDMLEPIEDEKIACEECHRPIRIDSIGRIYGEQDEIKIACDRSDCFFGGQAPPSDNDDDPDGGDPLIEEIATEEEILAEINESVEVDSPIQ